MTNRQLLCSRDEAQKDTVGVGVSCPKNGRAFYCLDNIETKCVEIVYNARRNLNEREPTSSSKRANARACEPINEL